MTGRTAEKPQGRYHHGDLRRALLDAALQHLGQTGAGALHLRELARIVGVSHRAVYRHFADREALLTAVAIDGWSRLGAELEAARRRAESSTSGRPVRALLRAYLLFALGSPGHYRVMLGPGSPTLGSDAQLDAAVLGAIRIAEREVLRQTRASAVAVRSRVFALWGLVHGLCDLILCGHARVGSSRKAGAWVLELCEPLLEDGDLR